MQYHFCHFIELLIPMFQLFNKSVSYFIPSTCLLCETADNQLICEACSNQFFTSLTHRCLICALPINDHDTHCGACLKNPPTFDATFAVCDYVAPLDRLVLALKFGHHLAVAQAMANLMANVFIEQLPDVLIAVPLSRQRLAQRGFNQALEVAKPLAKKWERPIHTNLLSRVRDTKAQAMLHPNQRQENILHAFSFNEDYADKIRGQHIGVVDDVMTTGATLDEVARCLKKHGASKISNLVFSRTLPH